MMNFGNKGEVGNTNYSCSMHCEGDKTYDQPGDCPVCGMHLVPVGSTEDHSEHSHAPASHEPAHSDHNHTPEIKKPAPPKAASGSGKYYCSMRCEGDKTYDQPGDCPVCGMRLLKEVSLETDRKSTRLNSSHTDISRMPSSA